MAFYLGYIAISLWCSTERGFLSARSALSYWFGAERILRGHVVSPAALQFL